MTEKIHIAVLDDHTLFRSGLAKLMNEFDELEVCFQASNGIAFQEQINRFPQVQLVLMDINMPVMDGYQTTKWIKIHQPHIHVLALSMYEDEKAIIDMLKSGAGGYLLKEAQSSDVLVAIKALISKGFFINEQVSGRLLATAMKSDQPTSITGREQLFLQLCASELTYKEIAEQMNISPRTADSYREVLFTKLNVKSRTGLVIYAIKNGWVNI